MRWSARPPKAQGNDESALRQHVFAAIIAAMSLVETPLQKIAETPRTLREIVVDRLRNAIILGHFASGERLVERTICEQLGVSRTVVREALRYLESEALVEIVPNRGPIVARLDWGQAEQIYRIRLLLETDAVMACAARISPTVAAELAEALNDMEQTAAWQEAGSFFEAATRFYQIIFAAAGHSVAWDIVQRLNGRISRLRAMTLADPDRNTPGPVRMRRIYEAVRAGDGPAAQAAVRAHLEEVTQIAHRVLHPHGSLRA